MGNKDLKIGLAFSGGGFRAASFSLGVLTYLNELKIENKPLLESVIALSTVSGGTITGAKYAIERARGKKLEEIYKEIYHFMTKTDLIGGSLDRLVSDENWHDKRVKSLINAFADVYNSELFKEAKFGELLNANHQSHLRHISFNATEFANAMQFRFQISEKIINPKPGEPISGIIGNNYYRLKESIAAEIRMADILAASSCFPAGFEPINFPTDFILDYQKFSDLEEKKGAETDDEFSKRLNDLYPVGLMDGGIVDNQGIEPLLLANQRMLRNMKQNSEATDATGNALDLLIVSDVASPYMEEYKVSSQKTPGWFSKRTPKSIITINTIILLVLGVLIAFGIYKNCTWLMILSGALFSLSLGTFFVLRFLLHLPEKFHVPKFFLKPLGKFLNLRLFVYRNLLMNRANSMLKLLNDVFLKHVRRLNYKRIYEDKSWKNRRIMNAIYELRPNEPKLKEKIESGKIPDYLKPSPAIENVSAHAASMGTTLWLTPEEINSKMPETIIACGQFTMCWNLLEYIEKIEKDHKNAEGTQYQNLIIAKEQAISHWNKFKESPYWLVEQYQQSQ